MDIIRFGMRTRGEGLKRPTSLRVVLGRILVAIVSGTVAAVISKGSGELVVLDGTATLVLWWILGRPYSIVAFVSASAVYGFADHNANWLESRMLLVAECVVIALVLQGATRRYVAAWSLRRSVTASVALLILFGVVHSFASAALGITDRSLATKVVLAFVLGVVLALLAMAWRGVASAPGRESTGLVTPLVMLLALVSALQITTLVWQRSDEDRLQLASSTYAASLLSSYSDVMTSIGNLTTTAPQNFGSPETFATDVQPVVFGQPAISAAALVDLHPDGTVTQVAMLSIVKKEGDLIAPLRGLVRTLTSLPAPQDGIGLGPLTLDAGIAIRDSPRSASVPHMLAVTELSLDRAGLAAGARRFLVVAMALPQLVQPPGFAPIPSVLTAVTTTNIQTGRVLIWSPEGQAPIARDSMQRLTTVVIGSENVTISAAAGEGFAKTLAHRLVAYGSETLFGLVLLVIVVRLVEVQRADRERRARESVLAASLDATPGAAMVFESNLRVELANRESVERFGGNPVGSSALEVLAIMAGVTPDDERMSEIDSAICRVAQGDGGVVELVVDGHEGLRIFDVAIRPLSSIGPQLTGGFIQAIDVTEQRARAMRLSQAERLEALGTIAGGMAHDFNNLLFVIQGNMQLLSMSEVIAGDDRLQLYLDRSREAVDRGTAITRSLLAVARSQPVEEQVVEIQSFVESLTPLLQQALGSTHEFDVAIADDVGRILRVDAGRLSGALLNLVVNARDAMSGEGHVQLVVGRPTAEEMSRLGGDSFVAIRVTDNGSGMPHAVASRAFELFYTTKRPGAGTGLGLATVYAFATQSGGTATIQTAPGVGTTVSLLFPLSEADPAADDQLHPTEGVEGRSVLIVDDEPVLTDLVCSWVRDLEMVPWSATSAEEAVNIATHARPDFLITDVNLGFGMDGLELFDQLHSRFPEMRTVVMTAFSNRTRELGSRGLSTLTKPFSREDLATALRRATAPTNDTGDVTP